MNVKNLPKQICYDPLEVKSRWIPVSERLPEDSDQVLIAFKMGSSKNSLVEGACYWKEIGWAWANGDDMHAGYIVTHWMPLPKPPSK